MLAQLIPSDGKPPININRDVTVVGRKAGLCDVVLNDGNVSKLQCLIIRTDGLLFIRDLGSTNGTKVNGQKVTRGALLPGDELSFANVRYRVHLGPGEPEYGTQERTEMITSFPDSVSQRNSVSERNADAPQKSIPVEAGSDSDVRLISDDSAG